jgi:hypothetical protein
MAAVGIVASAANLLPSQLAAAAGDTIRAFRVNIPEAQLVDLRRRIAATRWPDQATVSDRSQGNQLGKLREIVRYWGTGYDWRKVEARLNALPMFMTGIDGADIHFIHVRSRHESALPLIVTHGWPGSVIEQLKIIDPLTNPTAHGGNASDAFHLVIPSCPGAMKEQSAATTENMPSRAAAAVTTAAPTICRRPRLSFSELVFMVAPWFERNRFAGDFFRWACLLLSGSIRRLRCRCAFVPHPDKCSGTSVPIGKVNYGGDPGS